MDEADSRNQRVGECAKAITLAVTQASTVDGKVNLPTLVANCARMSGRYMLRSLKLDLSQVPPGQPVLHARAEECTTMLVRFCATVLQSLGTTLPDAPTEPFDQVRERLKMDFVQAQALLEPVLAPLQAHHALGDEQMAKAAVTAAGALIHQFTRYMPAAAGFGCAVYGITEGLRTAPNAT